MEDTTYPTFLCSQEEHFHNRGHLMHFPNGFLYHQLGSIFYNLKIEVRQNLLPVAQKKTQCESMQSMQGSRRGTTLSHSNWAASMYHVQISSITLMRKEK
jgi:hypothetical protein